MKTVPSPWLVTPQPRRNAQLRLFCFPYAGGAASVYRHPASVLPESIELVAVQLPGRETRFRDRPTSDMGRLVRDLADAMAPYMEMPYATFGHSLGTILSCELVQELARRGWPEPQHMVMSGRGAPHVQRSRIARYLLPDREFIEELRKIEGTPQELLDNDELMELLLPTLRADFTLAEAYRCDRPPLLPCGMSVYGGTADDEVPRGNLEAWQDCVSDPIRLRMFPGGHFFIHGSRESLWQAVGRDVGAACAALA
jgi:medium-chain acyl-[acyl-carrier-protein] hydrolase